MGPSVKQVRLEVVRKESELKVVLVVIAEGSSQRARTRAVKA